MSAKNYPSVFHAGIAACCRQRLLLLAACLLVSGGCRKTSDIKWGYAIAGVPTTAALQQLQASPLPPQLLVFFQDWSQPFPTAACNAIVGIGAVPCISWEPMLWAEGPDSRLDGERILHGEFDPYLRAYAAAAAAWQKPLLLRFAHEMNTAKYHWGMTMAEQYGPAAPQLYQQLFRYVASFFRETAPNVQWVFCVNAESVPDQAWQPDAQWNQIEHYWPGAQWVDIVGIDGYNWGYSQTFAEHGWQSRPQTFAEIFSPMLTRLRALAPDKPLWVFETATVGTPQAKLAWLADGLQWAQSVDITGVVWFQVDKENNWLLPLDAAAAELAPLLKR